MLAHGQHAEIFPARGIASEEDDGGLENALTEEFRHLIQEDHVDTAFRGKVGQGHGDIGLEVAARFGILAEGQDGDVVVGVRPRAAPRSRAEQRGRFEAIEAPQGIAGRVCDVH